MEWNVIAFGALGDGVTNDTHAIQNAIHACQAAGGGRVTFPGGKTYRAGAISLCSDLELHLEMGAVLKGSDCLADYLLPGGKPATGSAVPSYVNCEYDGAPEYRFLHGKGCSSIAITGPGIIDGNEEAFYGQVTKWHIEGSFYPRAPMLFLEDCQHVSIREVTFRRSAFWTVHLVGCQDVGIHGIRILNNLRMANCDGIDPDHCQNVRISGCHIECADDCIVFKNTAAAMAYGPCENITVTGCTLISTSAAIKFGSESEALFRNILVENCAISRSNRGISLQLRDAGSIENVIFRGITIDTRLFHRDMFWGQAEPIAITVLPRKPEAPVGTVSGIHFQDIFCTGENGILLYSHAPGGIGQVSFQNIRLTLRSVTHYQKGIHDLRPTFGPARAPEGLHYAMAHNCRDVRFQDCRFAAAPEMASQLHEPWAVTGCENLRSEGETTC